MTRLHLARLLQCLRLGTSLADGVPSHLLPCAKHEGMARKETNPVAGRRFRPLNWRNLQIYLCWLITSSGFIASEREFVADKTVTPFKFFPY